MRPKRVRHAWVNVNRIIVSSNRYFSRPSKEVLEALEKALLKEGESFTLSNPIIVNYARDSGEYILVDGFDRLQLHRKHGFKRICCTIREFDRHVDAREDAEWGSFRINVNRGQRDAKEILSFVRKHTNALPLRRAVKILVEEGGLSRSYAYKLASVARDEKLSKSVLNGTLSLRKAIEILEGKAKTASHVRQIREKPGEPIISGKEAISETQKIAENRGKRISAEKPRRGRPRKERAPGLTASLRDSLERAFNALGVEESAKEILMSRAAEVLGDQPIEIQVEAVKRWRDAKGLMTFEEALEYVKGAKPPERPQKRKHTIRDVLREVELGLDSIGFPEEDKQDFLKQAKKFFKKVDPELAFKAVRIWRSRGCNMAFIEALEEARKGVEVPEPEEHKVFRCPRCGEMLVCPSCGWPRGIKMR